MFTQSHGPKYTTYVYNKIVLTLKSVKEAKNKFQVYVIMF